LPRQTAALPARARRIHFVGRFCGGSSRAAGVAGNGRRRPRCASAADAYDPTSELVSFIDEGDEMHFRVRQSGQATGSVRPRSTRTVARVDGAPAPFIRSDLVRGPSGCPRANTGSPGYVPTLPLALSHLHRAHHHPRPGAQVPASAVEPHAGRGNLIDHALAGCDVRARQTTARSTCAPVSMRAPAPTTTPEPRIALPRSWRGWISAERAVGVTCAVR